MHRYGMTFYFFAMLASLDFSDALLHEKMNGAGSPKDVGKVVGKVFGKKSPGFSGLPSMYLDRPKTPGPIPSNPTQGITVVIMGYTDGFGMKHSACHHASMTPLVHEVLIVWNSEVEEWNETDVHCETGEQRAKVRVLPQKFNTLLNRYSVWPDIHTECVLLLDDDVLIKATYKLKDMYDLWRRHPLQIVGISGRCPYQKGGRAVYDFRDCAGHFSATSGQGNMLHRNYMQLFMASQPKDMLEHMYWQRPTCEDLALNFLVSNATGLPPLEAFDAFEQQTIQRTEMHSRSSMNEWLNMRAACIDKFTRIYGRYPLVGALPP